jgi:hypothetical protein
MKLIKTNQMKNLCFIILTIIFLSCSNDEDSSNNNSGLLKTIITYNVTNFGTQTFKSDEVNLFYSENNKIDYVTVENFSPNSSGNKATIKYHYSGDLITLKERFIENNTTSQADDYFEYDNLNRIVKYKRYHSLPHSEYTYEYLSNGNIIQTYYTQQGLDFIPYSSENFTFDSNLNLTSRNFENYEYDNKLSPTNGILGLDKIYYIDQYSDDDFYPTYFNNIIYQTNSNNGTFFEVNSTYEYNSDNKPIKKIQNGLVVKEYLYY